MTKDIDVLGKQLPVILDDGGNIKEIKININGVIVNFFDLMKEKNSYLKNKNGLDLLKVSNSKFKFVYVKSIIDYVLAINDLDINTIEIFKYSMSGVLISRVIDNYSSTIKTRSKGNTVIYMDNNNIVNKQVKTIK